MSEAVARRRLSPDQRREQILVAAERLFAERPYVEVSTTELAAAAGVARGLLNHYFGDKRALYLEVVRRAALLPTLEDVPLPTGSLAERVDAAVHWFLGSITPERATYLTIGAAEGIGDDAEVRAILEGAHDLAAAGCSSWSGRPCGRGVPRLHPGLRRARPRHHPGVVARQDVDPRAGPPAAA